MQLSKRLQLVASFVSKGNIVADIGTDHGYIPVYLVSEGIAPYAYACDVNKGPLERAKVHIAEAGLTEQIEIRLGSGLSVLKPYEAESIVISGMGGPLMQRLLEENWEVTKSATELVLSPHSEIDGVRRYLHQKGFCIEQEAMVLDEGKFYTVMRAVTGSEESYSDLEYRFGRYLIRERAAVFQDYLQDCIRKLRNIENRLLEAGMTEENERFLQNHKELLEAEYLYRQM